MAGALLVLQPLVTSGAHAQKVVLEIKPHIGDTMRMRLDQRVEMSGTTRLRGGDSTASVVTTLLVLSRAIVEARDKNGTIVLAATDSVALTSTGADSALVAAETRRALQGKRVRLRIAPDGATEMIGDASGVQPELHALFAQMPATLPRGEVAVGSTWSRVMVAPLTADPSAPGGGTLKANFRLDSLSANGDIAYLTLVGTLARAPEQPKERPGMSMTMSGSMNGSMMVDRRRGWITDARMTFTVRSVMTPPTGSTSSALRFRMKVTQWMRAIP